MPVLSVSRIADDDLRKRMGEARSAYLDDRFDDSVALSVGVYLDVVGKDPDALAGTRLDVSNFRAQWPDYGVTLAGRGTPEVHAVFDGRTHAMSSAVCYFEYTLEVVLLAEARTEANRSAAKG